MKTAYHLGEAKGYAHYTDFLFEIDTIHFKGSIEAPIDEMEQTTTTTQNIFEKSMNY